MGSCSSDVLLPALFQLAPPLKWLEIHCPACACPNGLCTDFNEQDGVDEEKERARERAAGCRKIVRALSSISRPPFWGLGALFLTGHDESETEVLNTKSNLENRSGKQRPLVARGHYIGLWAGQQFILLTQPPQILTEHVFFKKHEVKISVKVWKFKTLWIKTQMQTVTEKKLPG